MADARLDVVFVFLDEGNKNLYQVRQWIQPLQRLSRTRNVTVLYVSDAVTSLLADTGIGAAQVELQNGLVDFLNDHQPRLLLYPNQNVRNFYALRYSGGLHAWVSHGESEKAYMFQHTLKRYDLYFAAGQAALERSTTRINGFKPERVRKIGRPQIADTFTIPDWFKIDKNSTSTVLYAPTWEGVTGSTRYTSVDSHGAALVQSLIRSGCQVVYRPHPLLGSRDREVARADLAIRKLLQEENSRRSYSKSQQSQNEQSRSDLITHHTDSGDFGWQLQSLDILITDVSAVAYDWLATGKPLVVTQPTDDRAVMIDSPLFESVPRLTTFNIDEVLADILSSPQAQNTKTLSEYYFQPSPANDELFETAVTEAIEMSEQLSTEDRVEPFMPRGKRLGWLRYANFAIRLANQIVGAWSPRLDQKKIVQSKVLYTHFSDPFDLQSLTALVSFLRNLAKNKNIVFATNQVTTKLFLRKALGQDFQNIQLVACVSAADSESLISRMQPDEVRYLKDHPTNLAMLRQNGVNHVLYAPENDPNFVASHSLIMYDEVRSKSKKVIDQASKIHMISQPSLTPLH